MKLPSRRSVLPLAAGALAAAVALSGCTSSGSSRDKAQSSLSAAVSSYFAATPSTSTTAPAPPKPGERWSAKYAAVQLTQMLTQYQQSAQAAQVTTDSSFAEVHAAVQNLSLACDTLVTAVRNGAWPATAKAKAVAFAAVQDEECAADARLAAAATVEEYKAVPRLPADHAQKLFDSRRALEVALGL